MGNILSRFKSLESTKETLARIHTEIEEIEDYKWITLRNQNHIIGFYIFGLSILYAIFVVASLYFYYLQRLKNKGIITFIFYIVTFPILAYFLRNFLKSYYQHKLAVQEDRLHELKRSKRKILDGIMETETYKVAKELIEKYDPSMLKNSSEDQSMRLNQSMNNSILRQRVTPMNPMNQTAMASLSSNRKLLPPQSTMTPKQPAPGSQLALMQGSQMKPNAMNQPPSNMMANRPPPFNPTMMRPPPIMQPRRTNLVRPICAQDRSIVEKVVDYLVGDGPNNRYGLICKFCYSHNGMALKEEFDYLNFRCCFCNILNLAKKQKPLAPTLASYENAKDNLADETLNESIQKFKIDDDSADSSKQSTLQIEEIENKLNETKLEESETKSGEDDEMQVDDCITSSLGKVENTQQVEELSSKEDESKGEELNEQLNDMKLSGD